MAEPIVLKNIIHGGWRDYTFEPFREGVEICRLIDGEPAVAMLRYAPGAGVPLHLHTGLETIIVLDGSQGDETGVYETGTVVLNPVGYQHAVTSEEGCMVLIQWVKPVEFIDG